MEFQLTKFVHVLLAIVAVGFNASYGIWLARVANAPQATQSHVLRTIKFLDDRIANPAYGLLLVTGLFMVFNTGIPVSRRGSRSPSACGSCSSSSGSACTRRRFAIRSVCWRARGPRARSTTASPRGAATWASFSGSS